MSWKPLGEKEIQIAATLLVDQHGTAAEAVARERLKEFGASNKSEGYEMWARILEAVQQLMKANDPASHRRN